MTAALRVVDTGLASARSNVALSAALAELHADGRSPDTLRLHTYPLSVLLAHGQPAASVDLAFCRDHGIAVARRITGGGAVLMSPRMLAWEIVVQRAGSGLDLLMARACRGVAEALVRLGAAAVFSPPAAVTIGGRKVSGAGGFQSGGSALVQGTLIIEDEIETMAAVLRSPPESLRPLVTNLHAELAARPSRAAIATALISALAEAFDRRATDGTLSPTEAALAARLLDADIGCDAFVLGTRTADPPEHAP